MTGHVLITGSAGTLGRAACAALAGAGVNVFGFDRIPTPGVSQSVVGDLSDSATLDRLAVGARAIIHLAATPDDAHFPRGEHGDNFVSELVPSNILGSYHVMEAARKGGVPRVVLASTGQVVDGHLNDDDVPVDGSTPPRPRYLYACTKVFLEALGQVYAKEHGIEVMAVRLGWCPRPGQDEEFRRSRFGPNVYLSPGDAGRFFLAAVTAERVPSFSVLYATSTPATRVLYDLSETTRITGFIPVDRCPA